MGQIDTQIFTGWKHHKVRLEWASMFIVVCAFVHVRVCGGGSPPVIAISVTASFSPCMWYVIITTMW